METAKLLIDQYRLKEESCSKVVSDLHIDLLAQSCCAGGAWKTLAPHLELERAVVEDIDRKQVEDNEKRSAFLYKWKQMKGSEATYMKLVRGLLLIRRRMDAEELLKLLVTSNEIVPRFSTDTDVNPSSLPTDLRRDLKQQLRFSLNDIKSKYTLFIECVRSGIKMKGVSATELSTFLLSQSVFDYDEQDYKLFSDDKDVLEKATEVDHIFNLLITEYATFLNYEIFVTLAEKYELTEGMNYPQLLQDFINKHKVSEFLEINPTLLKYHNSSKKVTLKIDVKPTCKLAKVKELSEAIADKMKWNPSAVRILDIGEGCITVTLIIPANLADCVFNRDTVFTEKQRQDLIHLNILSIKFNGKIYQLKDEPTVKAEEWEWSLWGEKSYCAYGPRDVLILVSSEDLQGEEIVPRKKGCLTLEDMEWLRSEGISEECWSNDASLMKARYRREKNTHSVQVLGQEEVLTRERALQEIRSLMTHTKQQGVVLHYTGPGKKNTGDWCFQDGFITFTDITKAYMECFQEAGKSLSITSDCSYSGQWTLALQNCLDEVKVQPCGHSARRGRMLLKVRTSCGCDETPHTMLYSARGAGNDTKTGKIYIHSDGYRIEQGQNSRSIDSTLIACEEGASFETECSLPEDYTWHSWREEQRKLNNAL